MAARGTVSGARHCRRRVALSAARGTVGGAWWRRLAEVLGGGAPRRCMSLSYEGRLYFGGRLKSEVSEVVDAETGLLKLVSFPV